MKETLFRRKQYIHLQIHVAAYRAIHVQVIIPCYGTSCRQIVLNTTPCQIQEKWLLKEFSELYF